MSRLVQFRSFGGPEVLELIEVDPPHAAAGQVRVRVQVAGLNPIDYKIFGSPEIAGRFGARVPSGNGNDFAGVVDEVGEGVEGLHVGDQVFGGRRCLAQADHLVIEAGKLLHRPQGLSIEQAGCLDIAGRTAWASVRSLGLTEADTVLVSAAAGGVGVLAAQLALRSGATVIGTAGSNNQAFLARLGVVPVEYGAGLSERIAAAAPRGITAVLDNHGSATLELALALGVPSRRINTIAAHDFAAGHGIATIGGFEASLTDLAQLADLIAQGEIELPIDSTYALERVADAYRHLIAGHLRGKVALVTA